MEIFSKTQMIQSDLSNYDSEIFTFSQDNAALAFMLFPGAEYDSDLVNKIGLLSKAEHTISVVTQDGFDSFTSGLDTSDIGKTAKGIFLIQTFSHDLIEDILVCHVGDTESKPLDIFKSIELNFSLNHKDTIAFAFINENCQEAHEILSAFYASRRFPCFLVGGFVKEVRSFSKKGAGSSDGMDIDAAIVFIKLKNPFYTAVLRTQHYKMLEPSFVALDVSEDGKRLYTVIDPKTLEIMPAREALKKMLPDFSDELDTFLTKYTLGININGECILKSVKKIYSHDNSLRFFLQISPGDHLHLFKATEFTSQTYKDLSRFLESNDFPVAAVMFDCVLRPRISFPSEVVDLLECPTSGFTTAGEIYGVDFNSSMVGVFFFEKGKHFYDERNDLFPLLYGSFCEYYALQNISSLHSVHFIQQFALGASLNQHNSQKIFHDSAIHATLKKRIILLEESLRKAQFNARIDTLTGLYNRRILTDIILEEYKSAVNQKYPISILMIDIDNFKTVNDTWGHGEGDRVLIDFSKCLKEFTLNNGTAIRTGGEEFLITLPHVSEEKGLAMANDLRLMIAQKVFVGTPPQPITCSIGLFTSDANVTTFSDFLKKADLALYVAKTNGRNQVRQYSSCVHSS